LDAALGLRGEADQLEEERADVHAVALEELPRLAEELVVDEGAVGCAAVLDDDRVPLALDQAVLARDRLILKHQFVVRVSADVDAVQLDRDGPGMAVFPRDSKHLHLEPSRLAARLAGDI
jgi:hypothetical protein